MHLTARNYRLLSSNLPLFSVGIAIAAALMLVTGRPAVISDGGSDAVPTMTSKPILMPRCTVGDCCSCRISFGASLNTKFSRFL